MWLLRRLRRQLWDEGPQHGRVSKPPREGSPPVRRVEQRVVRDALGREFRFDDVPPEVDPERQTSSEQGQVLRNDIEKERDVALEKTQPHLDRTSSSRGSHVQISAHHETSLPVPPSGPHGGERDSPGPEGVEPETSPAACSEADSNLSSGLEPITLQGETQTWSEKSLSRLETQELPFLELLGKSSIQEMPSRRSLRVVTAARTSPPESRTRTSKPHPPRRQRLLVSDLVKEQRADDRVRKQMEEHRARIAELESGRAERVPMGEDDILREVSGMLAKDAAAKRELQVQELHPELLFTLKPRPPLSSGTLRKRLTALLRSMRDTWSRDSALPVVEQCFLKAVKRMVRSPKFEYVVLPRGRQLVALLGNRTCPARTLLWLYSLSLVTCEMTGLEHKVGCDAFDILEELFEKGAWGDCPGAPWIEKLSAVLENIGASVGEKGSTDPEYNLETEAYPGKRQQLLGHRALRVTRMALMMTDWSAEDIRAVWTLGLRLLLSPVGAKLFGSETNMLMSSLLRVAENSPMWDLLYRALVEDGYYFSERIHIQAAIVTRCVPLLSSSIRLSLAFAFLRQWINGPAHDPKPRNRLVMTTPRECSLQKLLELLEEMPVLNKSTRLIWLRGIVAFVRACVERCVVANSRLPASSEEHPEVVSRVMALELVRVQLARIKSPISRFQSPVALRIRLELTAVERMLDVLNRRSQRPVRIEDMETNDLDF